MEDFQNSSPKTGIPDKRHDNMRNCHVLLVTIPDSVFVFGRNHSQLTRSFFQLGDTFFFFCFSGTFSVSAQSRRMENSIQEGVSGCRPQTIQTRPIRGDDVFR